MEHFTEMEAGTLVEGLVPGRAVRITAVEAYGEIAVSVTYRDDSTGAGGDQMVFRDQLGGLRRADGGRPWSFDGAPELFRLVSEGHRIRLAHLFDPLLAVHTSDVTPLPHQLAAVYESMLPRQPLRYLLADDPGAGKTIMAGLLIKELRLRGDLERCLIVCPANLDEQWQDEMSQKFGLAFDLVGRPEIAASVGNNPWAERDLVISRIDLLKQDENMDRLRAVDRGWDLIVVDEAHKMSATYFGNEVKRTARYRLGQLLSEKCRHFLLMTATPHRGKEEDFQLFMGLLDGDRFEGKQRDGTRSVDVQDLMRRMLKEDLVGFDSRPLFPERFAYTVNYELSDSEAVLYEEVTKYVREEMNRVDRFVEETGDKRRGTVVGFALTILQRRLASSPAAIHSSLTRRLNRLRRELEEARLTKRVAELKASGLDIGANVEVEDLEDDLDESPEGEAETIVDLATAARTIDELAQEIRSLERLVELADGVRNSGVDHKWERLREVLQDDRMRDEHGKRHKLVIFTEHRDTLNYLVDRVTGLTGRPDAVVAIHGGLLREDRRKTQARFVNEPDVQFLIATDAAGEGVNLQRAHLMINYDLPWNPNRIEQRFGRIHRFGQREVCHLWNLVAYETREGAVYQRLFEKLEEERAALGGKVFDVLGRAFTSISLRDLMLEAIRYGSTAEARAYLQRTIESQWGPEFIDALIEERALDRTTIDAARLRQMKDDMDRAEARRLVPHFIESFFVEAFSKLGGTVHRREPGRYQVTHVPAEIRNRDRIIGRGEPVTRQYERICFDRAAMNFDGKPPARFVAPGHALLDCTIDLLLERHRDILRRGAVLIDEADEGREPRVLFSAESVITDGSEANQIISRRLEYIEVARDGTVQIVGSAPYLDYRPPREDEGALVRALLDEPWVARDLEATARQHAAIHIVAPHLRETQADRMELVAKTSEEVQRRLRSGITHWSHRAFELQLREEAGRRTRLSSDNARRRVAELEERLRKRLAELEQQRQVIPRPPVVQGGALIIPARLLRPEAVRADDPEGVETRRIEALAMTHVMASEEREGREPVDVSALNRGWDIESREPGGDGRLRFIEVKGRRVGASTVCVTKNELLTCLNKRDQFYLAIVEIDGDRVVDYWVGQDPLRGDWSFALTSQNLDLSKLRRGATL